jgi:hypothetical protein
VIIVFFALMAAYPAYWIFINVALPFIGYAARLAAGAAISPFSFGTWEWQGLLLDALAGMATGALVGVLSLARPKRREALHKIADAVGERKVFTATRLGWTALAIHVSIGAMSGAIVGLVGGISLLHLASSGSYEAAVSSAPALHMLTAAGFWGGGGTGPDGGASFLILLALFVVIVVLTLIVAALGVLGVSGMAGAAAEGAATEVGKSVGGAIVLALTRVWTKWTTPKDAWRHFRHEIPALDSSVSAVYFEGWRKIAIRRALAMGAVIGILNAALTIVATVMTGIRLRGE